MQTRFMQRVFSAMDDGEDELLAQVTNDVSDAERKGIKDTLQMRYIRMPDLVIKAVDNRTGEETLIKRSGSCMILRPADGSFDPGRNRILASVATDPLASLLPLFCCERAPQVLRDKVFACFSANYFGIGARETFNITPEQRRKLMEQEDKKRELVAKYDEQLRKLEDNPNNQVVTDYGISTDTGIQDKIAEIRAKRDLAQAGEYGVRAVREHDRNSMEKYAKDSWNANARLDMIESNKERAKHAEDKQKEARRDFQQGSGMDRYKGYGGRGTNTTKSTVQPSTRTYSSDEGSMWSDSMGYEYMQKMFGLGKRLWDMWRGGPRHYERPSRYDQGKTPSSERPPANSASAGNSNTGSSVQGAQDKGGDTPNARISQNGAQNDSRPLEANDNSSSKDGGRQASGQNAPDYGKQIADLGNAMNNFMTRIEEKIDGIKSNSGDNPKPQAQSKSSSQEQSGNAGKEGADVDVSPHSGAGGAGSGAQTPPPYDPSGMQPPPHDRPRQQPAGAQTPPPYNPSGMQPPPHNPPPQMSKEEEERMAREQDLLSQLKQGLGADMQSQIDGIHNRVAGRSDDDFWKMMNDEYGVKGPSYQQRENIRANIENVAKYRANQFQGDDRDIQAFNQRMADAANAKWGTKQDVWDKGWAQTNQDYANSLGRYIGQKVGVEGKDESNAHFYYVDSNGNRQYLSGPGYLPAMNRDSVATAISHNLRNKVDSFLGNFGSIDMSSPRSSHPVPGRGAQPASNTTPAPGNNAQPPVPDGSVPNSAATSALGGQFTPPEHLDSLLNRMGSGSSAIQGGYADQRRIDANINDNDAFLKEVQAKANAAQGRIANAMNTARGNMNQVSQQFNSHIMDGYEAMNNQALQSAQAHSDALRDSFARMRQSAQDNNEALRRQAERNERVNSTNQMLAGNYR